MAYLSVGWSGVKSDREDVSGMNTRCRCDLHGAQMGACTEEPINLFSRPRLPVLTLAYKQTHLNMNHDLSLQINNFFFIPSLPD